MPGGNDTGVRPSRAQEVSNGRSRFDFFRQRVRSGMLLRPGGPRSERPERARPGRRRTRMRGALTFFDDAFGGECCGGQEGRAPKEGVRPSRAQEDSNERGRVYFFRQRVRLGMLLRPGGPRSGRTECARPGRRRTRMRGALTFFDNAFGWECCCGPEGRIPE